MINFLFQINYNDYQEFHDTYTRCLFKWNTFLNNMIWKSSN